MQNQLYLGIYKTAKEAAEWADKAYWLMNRDNLQGNLNFPELASTYNEQVSKGCLHTHACMSKTLELYGKKTGCLDTQTNATLSSLCPLSHTC